MMFQQLNAGKIRLKIQRMRTQIRLIYFYFRLILLVLTVVFSLVLLSSKIDPISQRNCFADQTSDPVDFDGLSDFDEVERLKDILMASEKPVPGRSIFFHKTTCHLNPKVFSKSEKAINFITLSSSQACAIESAALHNPNFEVFVLFNSHAYVKRNSSSKSDPLINALLTYPNVNLRSYNLWSYTAGTPIENWLESGDLFKSRYVVQHTSDFLRYVTLWRYGGIYLDLDVLILRSLENLPPNFCGMESNTKVANSIMNFELNGAGHDVAELCLSDFQNHFDGKHWSKNGPDVITRVMESICHTNNLLLMMDSKRCQGFQLYPQDSFYSIHFRDWRNLINVQDVKQESHTPFLVRVKNKVLSLQHLNIPLKQNNCPKVFAAEVS